MKKSLSGLAPSRAIGGEGTYRQVPENEDVESDGLMDRLNKVYPMYRGGLPEDREPDVLEFFEALDPKLKRRRR